jgi:hypothetical protein
MAQYTNNTEQSFVFPSLSLLVEPGDTFESDDAINIPGIDSTPAPKKGKAAEAAPTDSSEAEAAEVSTDPVGA